MLELTPVPAAVIGCFGRPGALDRLAETAELSVRVAPDELLLLFAEGGSDRQQRVAQLETRLLALDSGSLVLDLSSGYAVWALHGEDRCEAFCRLSTINLPDPPAAVQGLVAHVPAKVIVRPDALFVLVSSVLSHHLRARVLGACADLAPVERSPREITTRTLEATPGTNNSQLITQDSQP